jgi:hypothetical protein
VLHNTVFIPMELIEEKLIANPQTYEQDRGLPNASSMVMSNCLCF